MKKTLLFLVIFLINYMVNSQPYKAIRDNAEYLFCCQNCTSNDINSIKIDSIIIDGFDTIYFNIRFMRNAVPPENCGNLYGASWIGSQVIIKLDGFNYFFNKKEDTIKINTLAQLNNPWVLYSYFDSDNYLDTAYISGTIYKIDTMSFLGIIDTVKMIKLQVHNMQGDSLVSNLNSLTLFLSKNFGLIKLFDLYEFPYNTQADITSKYVNKDYFLVGKTNPNTGIINITAKEIFDYEIGDEFHTNQANEWVNPPYPMYQIQLINKVLSKTNSINHDTTVYTIHRCGLKHSWYGGNNTYEYYNDTITTIYNWSSLTEPNSFLKYLPNETYFNGVKYQYWDLSYSNNYNQRIVKYSSRFSANNFSNCPEVNNLIPGPSVYYYIEGCGGTYYYGPYDDSGILDHNKLVYYKKGNDIWGNPYNCETLLEILPNVSNKNKYFVSIIPNPVLNSARISIIGLNNENIDLEIKNQLGFTVLLKKHMNATGFVFDRGNLPSGLYFYSILTTKNEFISGKLIIE